MQKSYFESKSRLQCRECINILSSLFEGDAFNYIHKDDVVLKIFYFFQK